MDITINNIKYQIGKLDAFKQLHLARRLAPCLFALGKVSSENLDIEGSAALALMGPIAEALSKMDDNDVNYIVTTCLNVCERQQSQGFARVMNGSNLMFQDIDLSIMMQLAIAVIKENLGNFFPGELTQ